MVLWPRFPSLYRAALQWNADYCLRWGAGLAYYSLFSLAPLLVIAVDFASIAFGPDAARGQLEKELQGLLGAEPAHAVQSLVAAAEVQRGHTWAPIISYVVLIFGALGVFLHLRAALCSIWKLEPPQLNSILAVLFDYLLALLMVFCSGGLLLVTLLAGTVVTFVRAHFEERLAVGGWFWQLVDLATSIAVLTLLFATTYYILSARRIPWSQIAYGAAFAAVLFTIGKFALSLYLVFSGTESAYGAAGSLAVFLVWVYYSSQVLFFGAELIQVRRTEMASPAAQPVAGEP